MSSSPYARYWLCERLLALLTEETTFTDLQDHIFSSYWLVSNCDPAAIINLIAFASALWANFKIGDFFGIINTAASAHWNNVSKF
nr:hypothetical protein [Pseudobacteriovorax antillogorgiicola]